MIFRVLNLEVILLVAIVLIWRGELDGFGAENGMLILMKYLNNHSVLWGI